MRADNVHTLPGAVLPHSVEAEQAVLGSLLMGDTTAWSRVVGKLSAADFFRPDHRLIFAAIARLANAGAEADIVTVSARLQASGELDEAGGMPYVAKLARDTATAANLEAYAEVVRERSTRRQLGKLAESIGRAAGVATKGDVTAEELVADAQRSLLALQSNARTGTGLVGVQELTMLLIDDLDRRREKSAGLTVGLADFDRLTCGLEAGDLVVLAGRPGMGKTALLGTIALHVSRTVPVAVFSAEMPAQQLLRRSIANLGDLPQGRLRRAEQLTDDDWAAIARAAGELSSRQLWIDETPLPTLAHVRAESIGLQMRAGSLGLVLVDYVQLVQGAGANRYEQLRDVAYGFKALAKQLRVPVVVLAQINRGTESREDKRPGISDLRDSGAIEEAADIIGMLYSEGYYNPDFGMPYVLECAISKNRNGDRGLCLWCMNGERSRITVLDDGPRAQYRHLRAQQTKRGAGDDL
jgi:replicative DNA helicase